MRIDWFVPLRRKDGTKISRKGWFRRTVRVLGPTWVSSPVRRVVQGICLVVFFWLFLYVCWPYTARPAHSWPGWLPVEVDAENGGVTVAEETQTHASIAEFSRDMLVHVSDAGLDEPIHLGYFRIEDVREGQLDLQPHEPLSREQLDFLATSFGPWLLSESNPSSWPSHYADNLRVKERLAAELFLILDPLVSLSTAMAARSWVWSLTAAGVILFVCLTIPRGFCGYLCPLGTLIDLFDWTFGRHVKHFRVSGPGWWVHLKYYVLVAVFVAALFGVLLSGFVAAIPVVTRAAAFVITPLQTGVGRDWHQIPPIDVGHAVSLVLFCVILGLGFLQPRFWCKYLCPSGAVFSVGNLLRVSQRKVEASCIDCGKCVEICPFDAIKPDYTTRTADCTFCQTCGGVCPVRSIKFVDRWNGSDLKAADNPPEGETAIGRRGFLATAVGATAGAVGGAGLTMTTRIGQADAGDPRATPIVRPPGSVPEQQFLQLCIRCGECYQACPNDVLQPLAFQRGWNALWTPRVVANWSGCEPSCSNCGQVCPTGAIRALPLDEKRVARMGLAVVNETTCLPYAKRDECQLCVDECQSAGYDAIEFVRVGTEMDLFGEPVEGTGYLAPVVNADKCVGCGLCQTRCYKLNVKEKKLLSESAIIVVAGEGKEDRLMHGSYVELRRQEKSSREQQEHTEQRDVEQNYLPEFLMDSPDSE